VVVVMLVLGVLLADYLVLKQPMLMMEMSVLLKLNLMAQYLLQFMLLFVKMSWMRLWLLVQVKQL
jgi:hypothetical protein